MQASSDLVRPEGSEPALSYPPAPPQGSPLTHEYREDEEFPADLPVEYERLLPPVPRGGFRRVVRIFFVTVALFAAGFLLSWLSVWSVHKSPRLMVAVAIGLAIFVVVIGAACRLAFSVPKRVRSEPARRDLLVWPAE